MQLTVRFQPEVTTEIDRIRVEAPDGFLVGSVGPSQSIADMFGRKENPARWKFLRSLKAPTAWLDEIKVKKEARNRGVGTEIFRTTLDALAAHGIRYVVLSPRPERADDYERLERFYERFGFSEVRAFKGENLWSRLLVLDLAG